MPALPNVNAVMRIDYGFTVGEDLAAKCREFWQFGGSPSPADLVTLATTINDDWNTASMPSLYTADRSLTTVKITNLTSPTAGVGESATPYVGTRASGSLPASICVLESLEIARRYRGGHPRNYWPFGNDGDVLDAQKFGTAFGTEVKNKLTAWRNDWTTDLPGSISSVQPVNVSYYQGFTPFTGPTGRMRNISKVRLAPIVDLIISTIIRQAIASQRKRLLKLA